MKNQLTLLIMKILVPNVFTLCHSISDMLLERRHIICEPYSNTFKESVSMSHVSTASREEEASSERILLEVSASDSTGDCRLPGAG